MMQVKEENPGEVSDEDDGADGESESSAHVALKMVLSDDADEDDTDTLLGATGGSDDLFSAIQKDSANDQPAVDNEHRKYQVALLEMAKERNLIVCLPTGSGKTYIAMQLAKYYLPTAISEKKYIIFLATTVPLVRQQALYFRKHLSTATNKSGLKLFVGDMNVDDWDRRKWIEELKNQQVIVMTPQIFYDIMSKAYYSFGDVVLLILDECHNAGKDSVMSQIMKKYDTWTTEQLGNGIPIPRVLGLTATIIRGVGKVCDMEKEVAEFERLMKAKAITYHDYEEVLKHSTNAKLEYIQYSEDNFAKDPKISSWVLAGLKEFAMYVDGFNLTNRGLPKQPKIIPANGVSYGKKWEPYKEYVKVLKDVQDVYNELGLHSARLAACLKRSFLVIKEDPGFPVLVHMKTNTIATLTCLINRVESFEGYKDPKSRIGFASPKVKALTNLILEFSPKNTKKENNLCAVVFIQTRIMTQTLCWYFQDLVKADPELYGFIRPAFAIGSTTAESRGTAIITPKRQQEVVKSFHEKKYNIIFATSVLEEGLDVPSCNLVVRFDEIKSYPSFVQSMGRARKRDARFCVLVDAKEREKQTGRCASFTVYNHALSNLLQKKAEHVDSDDDEEEDMGEEEDDEESLPPYCPGGTADSPEVTMCSAISLVHEYCALLQGEKFAKPTPLAWWIEVPQKEGPNLYKAFVRFPHNSVVRTDVEGRPMKTRKSARRAAFLEAAKQLHEKGGLNSHLMPERKLLPQEVSKFLDEMELGDQATPRVKFPWYEKKLPHFAYKNIEVGQAFDTFVVHLSFQDLNSGVQTYPHNIYNLSKSSYRFGIVLPKDVGTFGDLELFRWRGSVLARFEKVNLFAKMGRGFISEELVRLNSFQRDLTEGILFLKPSYAHYSGAAPLFVVPLLKGKSNGDYTIAWDIIQGLANMDQTSFFQSPSTEDWANWRPEKTYEDKVVVPFYRKDIAFSESLANVEYVSEMTAYSQMSNGKTFMDHFCHLNLKFPNEPLLKCSKVGKQLNFISVKNRYRHRHGSKSSVEMSRTDQDLYFVPELVRVFPFPGSLLVQARFIPTIIHRIYRLLVAEELKLEVAHFFSWDTAKQSEFSNTSETEVPIGGSPTKKPRLSENLEVNPCSPQANYQHLGVMREIDINLIHPDELTMKDVLYLKKLRSSRFITNSTDLEMDEEPAVVAANELIKLEDVDGFIVKKLDEPTDFDKCSGPKSFAIMEALTVCNANDVLNLERNETLGDSFLKYCVSVQLYCDFPTMDEGSLTSLRSKIISNRNLFNLGMRKQIGERMSGCIFVPSQTWLPPGYIVPEGISKLATELDITPHAFAGLSLSEIEAMTFEERTELLKTKKDCRAGAPDNTTYEHTRLGNKSVADSVEALIGAYFANGGSASALRFMEWIGLRVPPSSTHYGPKRLFGTWEKPKSIRNDKQIKHRRPEDFMPGISMLEKLIGYQFKDRWLVVEAFTHSTYTADCMTGCYQRLEFLGDAVLDFLVTSHIFHMEPKNGKRPLTPGQLTDLRSALVNNVTFGSLVVRYAIHKHLLCFSKELEDCINDFVDYQESQTRQHQATRPFKVVTLKGYQVAKDVEVPKVVGDLFESLCGAVYLDTGMSLDKTWKIFYRLMKNEIDTFSENVPISPIRELYETYPPGPEFKLLNKDARDSRIGSIVKFSVRGETFYGTGNNKSCAKNAAARWTLSSLAKKRMTESACQSNHVHVMEGY